MSLDKHVIKKELLNNNLNYIKKEIERSRHNYYFCQLIKILFTFFKQKRVIKKCNIIKDVIFTILNKLNTPYNSDSDTLSPSHVNYILLNIKDIPLNFIIRYIRVSSCQNNVKNAINYGYDPVKLINHFYYFGNKKKSDISNIIHCIMYKETNEKMDYKIILQTERTLYNILPKDIINIIFGYLMTFELI
jgi:hypothetical protein